MTRIASPWGVFNCGPGCDTELKNFATIRARLGFSAGQFLLYGTAGYGFAHANASIAGLGNFGEGDTHGVVWGGGIEWAFAGNWSAKLEYLHADLGRLELDPALCVINCFTDINYETVRIGLNYRF